ncbi:hypothetical protein LPICM02_100021 [Pseudolactococcus piscium]|nr:hypothetical protein LPICM02_100021 [Lactococcus piscium]
MQLYKKRHVTSSETIMYDDNLKRRTLCQYLELHLLQLLCFGPSI